MNINENNELTTGQAAKSAGVARQTVLSWIYSGKLESMVRKVQAGLFRTDYKIDKAKFEEWLKIQQKK